LVRPERLADVEAARESRVRPGGRERAPRGVDVKKRPPEVRRGEADAIHAAVALARTLGAREHRAVGVDERVNRRVAVAEAVLTSLIRPS
jgi:hypothetical protein